MFLLLLLMPWAAQAADQKDQDQASLHVLSYNIWFDDRSGTIRYPRVIAYLAASRADIIGLQEVTPTSLQALRSSQLSKHYHISAPPKPGPYFNVLLSKQQPKTVTVQALPSRMGRHVLIVDFAHKKSDLRCMVVHLESLDRAPSPGLRKQQVAALKQLITPHCLLLGDFNFSSTGPFDRVPLHSLQDSATTAKDQASITYDVDNNRWANQTASPGERSRRLDRIYHSTTMLPQGFKVDHVTHSDHYPVRATVHLTEPNKASAEQTQP